MLTPFFRGAAKAVAFAGLWHWELLHICKASRSTNSSCTLIDDISASNLLNFYSGVLAFDTTDHLPDFIIYKNYLTNDRSSPKEISFRLINKAANSNFYESLRNELARFLLDGRDNEVSIELLNKKKF